LKKLKAIPKKGRGEGGGGEGAYEIMKKEGNLRGCGKNSSSTIRKEKSKRRKTETQSHTMINVNRC